jgi:uncharacterized membrane protein
LWLWPSVSAVTAGLAAVLVSLVRPTGGWVASLWPGDVDSASTLLGIVATAVITEATLTFSLTVVALQLASQQFSPRLLREVTRDPVSKVVLSILGGTFVFSATTVRGLHASGRSPSSPSSSPSCSASRRSPPGWCSSRT